MNYCLLFDSDGTLVDSEAINQQAMADELAVLHIIEDPQVLLNRYRGWQITAVLEDLGARHGLNFDHAFEQRFRARASAYFDSDLQPIPNIETALLKLQDEKCVASNAPMTKLRQVLAKTDLAKFFNARLFSAYDIKAFKPDPQLFLHAAGAMGFEPCQCIVIEDSQVGVQAALSAGMQCVCYCPHEKPPTLSDSVLMVRDMLELPDAIEMLKNRRLS